MKQSIRYAVLLICFCLLAACSPSQRLKSQAKAVMEPGDNANQTLMKCSDYLELLAKKNEPDAQAFNKCIENSLKEDGTYALWFCKLLSESGSEVSADFQQKCLSAASITVRAELQMRKYDQARIKYLSAVSENLKFVSLEDAQRKADEIYGIQYLDRGKALLTTITRATVKCSNASASVDEFWQLVKDHSLNALVEQPLVDTVTVMVKETSRQAGEKNYYCVDEGLKNLARLLNDGPAPAAAYAVVETKLAEWTGTGKRLFNEAQFLNAFLLFQGVRHLSLNKGDTIEVDRYIAELVQQIADRKEEPKAIFEKAGYLCNAYQSDIKYDSGYNEIIDLVLGLKKTSQGKILNCTEAKLPEELLPTTLAEVKYMVRATALDAGRKLSQSCPYSGGHTLNIYRVDYQVTVNEVQTGKQIAEATLPSIDDPGCGMIRTFQAKTDGYDLAVSDMALTIWLSSLQIP